MSELGQFLKQARMEKNLSLDQIQDMTKIRKRYLEALESGDYHILPGQFYARAFIKNYCEALGLQTEQVYKQFGHELPQVPKAPIDNGMPTRKKQRVKTSRSPKVGKWLTSVLLIFFIAIIGFFIWQAVITYWDYPDDQTIDPNQQTPGVIPDGDIDTAPDGQEEGPVGEGDPAEDEADPEPEPTPEPTPEPIWTRLEESGGATTFQYANADQFVITLEATNGDVWYDLTIPGEGRISSSTIRDGQDDTWDLTEHEVIQLRVGNARGMTLYMNGEPVETEGIPNAHNLRIEYLPEGTVGLSDGEEENET